MRDHWFFENDGPFIVVLANTGEGEDTYRVSEKATCTSFPARDRKDAHALRRALNNIVRFFVEDVEREINEWHPIETAPRDGSSIWAGGIGADGRWLAGAVSWVDPDTMFLSSRQTENRREWRGLMGVAYGIEFTHWRPLPEPPAGF